MTENQQKVIGLSLTQLSADAAVTEEAIVTCINTFSIINPLTDAEKDEVVRELHSRLAVRIDRGACVREEKHTSWYNAAKASITPAFWNRYRSYLQGKQGWNARLLSELDRSTDEIMDLLGNPKQSSGFQRRGLCIGDVQSGKTSNYIGLINKAADAGYRVIILLTGVIEKLRRQTQGRIDAGFIGLDSTAFTRDNKNDVWVGVGCSDPSVSGWAVTSTFSDFNTVTAKKIVGQLGSISVPVIFVLKKNKIVLEELEKWLRRYNTNSITNTIDLPMLLIDDEADNASVNTRETGEDPTAINTAIRRLLSLFEKANYVGFTATPYANIFIDPDSETEMLDSDLFPKNFISVLESPSNYIGARNIFQKGAQYDFLLKSNDDCEYFLPIRHKNDAIINEFPQSLIEAIASFFIANTVRDLRGHKKTHRTMMINISRFICIQNKIAETVDTFVREAQCEIQNYYCLGNIALQYETFKLLKSTFDKHFATIPNFEFTWDEIQSALKEAVMPVTVRAINGGNASKNLNYDEVDDGLRLIAVGGLSLSRGLTLEGLCISYFFRNSMMYDTLMQMGRWFGYREGYADICQIWMPDSAVAWYSYISEATDELRCEVHRMQQANQTPEDFGLCVRSDIAALLVTARNKMRNAQNYQRTVSLSGHVVETPYLHKDICTLRKNAEITETFLEKLYSKYTLHYNDPKLALKIPQYLNVEKTDILEFLNLYSSHSMNIDFQTDQLVQFIERNVDGVMDHWDVAIASGKGHSITFPGFQVKAVNRSFAVRDERGGALQMSGKNSRLGSRDHAKGGLFDETAKRIEFRERIIIGTDKELSQETYFKSGIKRNPLLVIYPVELVAKEDAPDTRKQEVIRATVLPVIGLSIGIPIIDGKEPQQFTYKINIVKYRELFGAEDEDFEENDETIAADV